MRSFRVLPVLATALLALSSAAVSPTVDAQSAAPVRFAKLYSTMDGEWQAVELDIDTASGAPLALGGRRLSFRDARGVERSQVLPATWDGPVRRGKLLMASKTFDGWGFEYGSAEIALARHILPIDGGTIELEGMDAWTFGPLPLDGRSALARDGTVVPALLDRYVRGFMEWDTLVAWDIVHVTAREYYHAGMDHYFVTARMTEIDLLEAGAYPGWAPTGEAFGVFGRPLVADPPPASLAVCRLLMLYAGGYTHVLSSNPGECASFADSSLGILETTAAFFTASPDPQTGDCPDTFAYDWMGGGRGTSAAPMSPVFRVWNGQAKANHRLVVGTKARDVMIARGWVPEGYGPTGVALCADWANPAP